MVEFIGNEIRVSSMAGQIGPAVQLVCPICREKDQSLGDLKCLTIAQEEEEKTDPARPGRGLSVPIHGNCGHNWNLHVLVGRSGCAALAATVVDDE